VAGREPGIFILDDGICGALGLCRGGWKLVRVVGPDFWYRRTGTGYVEAPIMPLSFTAKMRASKDLLILEAFHGKGRVVVVSSREAIQVHGLFAVFRRASEKFDAGVFDEVGRVRVFSSDFE
jgi:hypothetical protein